MKALGFEGADPADTERPSYHPAVLLKLYIYGYLNHVPSSWRLDVPYGNNWRFYHAVKLGYH